jgi:hypothetical protein
MPRYNFHVSRGAHSFDDGVGELHDTIEAAAAKARQIARELAQEPDTYRGYRIIVIDEGGNTIIMACWPIATVRPSRSTTALRTAVPNCLTPNRSISCAWCTFFLRTLVPSSQAILLDEPRVRPLRTCASHEPGNRSGCRCVFGLQLRGFGFACRRSEGNLEGGRRLCQAWRDACNRPSVSRRCTDREATMGKFDMIIRGGRVATASDTVACDIGIRNGRIAALGDELGTADEVTDARGKLVLPGGIDSHVHFAQPSGLGIVMADDFESGTRSAAFGGNTLVMPFCLQQKGQSLRQAVKDYHAKADGKCHVDVSFHLVISDPTQQVLG